VKKPKINYQFLTLMLSIVGSLVYGTMRFAKLEERELQHYESQCEKNIVYIESIQNLTCAVKCLTTTTDSLRYEIKFINFRNGLE